MNKDIDIKIYIVDDEEYYLNLEKISLAKYKFNDISIFNSGEDCLIAIENEQPDCVILDYVIKTGMNGDEILKIINDKFPDILVLVLSGQENIEVATNIIKNGAYDYIVKNKMTFFNLNSTLSKIKEIKINNLKLKKYNIYYILTIIATWIFGAISIYMLIKNF
jgi:polysaccharide export outer membrane protein